MSKNLDDILEYDAGQWIIENKEYLKERLKPFSKKQTEFFPDSLYRVYLNQYEDAAARLIMNEVTEALSLNAENRLRIDKKCIRLVARDLLEPPKEHA